MLTPIFTSALPHFDCTVADHRFRMLSIPAGTCDLGNDPGEEEGMYEDESPKRRNVSISAFALAAVPVTQALWTAVYSRFDPVECARRELPETPSGFLGDERPVETVSWHEATAFCAALNDLPEISAALPPGWGFRLPSEAEWEYAARCGQRDFRFAGGNELWGLGWYAENSESRTHRVGQRYPNAWGLYDMSGNIWEWCLDHWHDNYGDAPPDGRPWLTDDAGDRRVRRGGNWAYVARDCRSACRYHDVPGGRYRGQGLRLAASPVQREQLARP